MTGPRPYPKQPREELTELANRNRTNCPDCQTPVVRMYQDSGKVYAVPCGHLLWIGDVPREWKHESIVVE